MRTQSMARSSNGNKREMILDSALVEIAQRGFNQTTVAMIAKRAGVADGTIYLYFKNKEEILFSLFDRAMGSFIEEGKASLTKTNGAEARLRQVIELHLKLVGENRDQAIITQIELRHSIHFMDQLSRNQVRDYLEILALLVAQGQNEGIFRKDLDSIFIAKAIFGILDEMATDWVLSHRNTRLESKAPAVADFILNGLSC